MCVEYLEWCQNCIHIFSLCPCQQLMNPLLVMGKYANVLVLFVYLFVSSFFLICYLHSTIIIRRESLSVHYVKEYECITNVEATTRASHGL